MNIIEQLKDFIKEECLAEWLYTPNEVFAAKRPIDLIISGDIQPLQEMIDRLKYGVYSSITHDPKGSGLGLNS